MRTLITIAGTLLAGATPFAASAALRTEAVTVAGPGQATEAELASFAVTSRLLQDSERSELEELRRAVDELRAEKDRLRAEIEAERAGADSQARTETRREVTVRRLAQEPEDAAAPPRRTRWRVATTPTTPLESRDVERMVREEQRAQELYEGVLELEAEESVLAELESLKADLQARIEAEVVQGGDIEGLRHELARIQGEAHRQRAHRRSLEARLHAEQARAQALEALERAEQMQQEAKLRAELEYAELWPESDGWVVVEQGEGQGGAKRARLRRVERHEAHEHEHEEHLHDHDDHGRHDAALDAYENLYFGGSNDEVDDGTTKRVIVRTRNGETERFFVPGSVTVESEADDDGRVLWIDVDGEHHGIYTDDGTPSRTFIHDSGGVVLDVQPKIVVHGENGELIEIEAPEPPQPPAAPEAPRFFGASVGSGSAPSASGGGRVLRVRKSTAPSSGGGVSLAPRFGGGSAPAPASDDLLREVHDLTRAMLGELRELRAAVDELRRDVDARPYRSSDRSGRR